MSEARKRLRGEGPEVGLGVGGPELMMDSAFAKALQRYKSEEDKSLQRLQTLQDNYTQLQAQCTSAQEEMAAAQERHRDEIRALDKDMELKKNEVQEQVSVIRSLNTEKQSIESTLAQTGTELSAAKAELETIRNERDLLTSANATLKAEVSVLTSNIKDLNATFATQKAALEATIAISKAQVEELTTKADGLEGQITALEEIKTGFTLQISSTVSILSKWPGTDTATVPDLIEAVLINEDNAGTWRNAVGTNPIASILAETQNELETLKSLRGLASENEEYQSNLNAYAARLTDFSVAVTAAATSFSAEVTEQWSAERIPYTRKEAIRAFLTVQKRTGDLKDAVDALLNIKLITSSSATAGKGTTAAAGAPPVVETASTPVTRSVSETDASDAMADDKEIKAKNEAPKRNTDTAELGRSSRRRVGSENTQAFVTPELPAAPSSVTPLPLNAALTPQLPPLPPTKPAPAPSKLTALPSTSGGGGVGQAADVSETIESVKADIVRISDAIIEAGGTGAGAITGTTVKSLKNFRAGLERRLQRQLELNALERK